MLNKLLGVLKKVESKQNITLASEADANRTFFVARADITVGDKKYPCDTAIDLDVGQPKGSEKVSFTTVIHSGVGGENESVFDKAVDVLNSEFPGKFFHDVSDGSKDILYSTSERLNGLDQKIIMENIEKHSQVKGRVAPELEHLSKKLGLEPLASSTQTDKFVMDWKNVFVASNDLPNAPKIKYIPSEKKKYE